MKIRLLEGKDTPPLVAHFIRVATIGATDEETGEIFRDASGNPLDLSNFLDAAIIAKLFIADNEAEAMQAWQRGQTVLLIAE